MIENGATGETKTSMREALALSAHAREEAVHHTIATVMKSLQSQSGVELAIANALWADTGATIAPEFVRVCQEIYDAVVRTLDLNEPSAAVAINEWVAEKTRGKIPQIVTAGSIAGSPAVITNAVYFKGKFRDPFRSEETEPKTFHLAGGHDKLVPMMRRWFSSGAYRVGKKAEAAALSYEDSDIILFMILPKKGISPEQVLTEELLSELTAEQSVELDLSMPRFAIDFNSDLKGSLQRLGMGIAFQYPGADFSPIGSSFFFIGDVLHKTVLEVDEEGTVAAAALGVVLGSAMPLRPRTVKTLVFDRPFAIVLSDTITGATLFAGVIYEP